VVPPSDDELEPLSAAPASVPPEPLSATLAPLSLVPLPPLPLELLPLRVEPEAESISAAASGDEAMNSGLVHPAWTTAIADPKRKLEMMRIVASSFAS
jgi:hypothetical protein